MIFVSFRGPSMFCFCLALMALILKLLQPLHLRSYLSLGSLSLPEIYPVAYGAEKVYTRYLGYPESKDGLGGQSG